MPGCDVKKQSMVKGPGAAWNGGSFRQVIKILKPMTFKTVKLIKRIREETKIYFYN